MRNNLTMKRITISILLAFACITSAFAQHNFRTGYFLDGYTYKHKLNPALASDRGYFAIPVLGYTTLGVETNLALSTFLYPDGNGNLNTFISPAVNASEFMKGISTNNPLNANIDLSLISFGFHAGKSFHTVDMSFKTDLRTNIPGSMFSWAKQSGNTLDMTDFGVNADARMELSYGYSRSIGDKIRVGAKIKFIAAIAKVSYTMDQLTLTMNNDVWRVNSKGSGLFYAPGVGFITNETGAITGLETAFNEAIDVKNYGAAVDLGFSYDVLKWLTVSASLTDLGFINWNGVSKIGSEGLPIEYTGFENIGEEGIDVSGQFNKLGEDLLDMISPKVLSTNESVNDMLSMTAHLGVEARMPFYERLSVGALGTYRFDGPYSWWETRGSLNIAPLRWLSFSASYALSSYGQSYGGAINIHPNGLNIFLGIDSYKPALNISKQFIPVDSFNTNLALGVNIAYGKYHGRFPRK